MSGQQNIAFGILAGGKSSRMGRDKATISWNGSTFLNTILAAGSGFPEHLVSLSASFEGEAVRRLTDAGVKVVRDEFPDGGPLEGIRQILRHAESAACLITATDMPFLTAELLDHLAGRYSGRGNLSLTLRGLPEPLCSIYSRDCLPFIETLQQQGRRRPILLFDAVETIYVPLEETGFSEELLRNINSMDEYESLLAAAKTK